MGVRYFAFALDPGVAESAASDPRSYFRSRSRFAGEPSLPDDPELTLDLDKAWGYLQIALREPTDSRPTYSAAYADSSPQRPAYELVRGDVQHTDHGWKSFVRVLTASQVSAASRDFSEIGAGGIRDRLESRFRHDKTDRDRQLIDYTTDYARHAIAFLDDASRAGYGLAYLIG